MASPTYPGVYITEQISSSHPITGVATSITAFVGYTATGIDGRAELLNSFSDYERLFGGLAADSELSYAVQQFFQNGGSQAYVVRTHRHGATLARVVCGGPSGPGLLTFNALSSGAWANGEILIDIDFANVGQQLSGTLTVTVGQTAVTGSLAGFKSNLAPNDWLVFAVDPTQTPYQISAITDDSAGNMAPDTEVKSKSDCAHMATGADALGQLKPHETMTNAISLNMFSDMSRPGAYSAQVAWKEPKELGGVLLKSNTVQIIVVP